MPPKKLTKTANTRRKRVIRAVTKKREMVKRKEQLASVIAQIVANSEPEERLDIAQFIVNCGLDQIGNTLDIDMNGTLIIAPDDPEADLVQQINWHAAKTGTPLVDICASLLAQLAHPNQSLLN